MVAWQIFCEWRCALAGSGVYGAAVINYLTLQRVSCGTQADRRALNITLNSIGTELTRDDRRGLYSSFGHLYPHGHADLAVADDFDAIRGAMDKVPNYQRLFAKVGGQDRG